MNGAPTLIPGPVVDIVAILCICALGGMHTIEGRDAATAILVIVVGRLRPPADNAARPPLISGSGLVTILSGLAALWKGRIA